MTGLPMPDCTPNHCTGGVWIGLNAEVGQGYKWVDGTALTWQHWGPTQGLGWNQRTFVSFYPDNFSSANYDAVWDNYMWDHYPRTTSAVYYVRGGICKK
ncbi:hypothetical protein AAVH_36202 [Aphelenchoides avenae]|nr:hypothetical protein AAVH_36202 [Aphelenchus avenae]